MREEDLPFDHNSPIFLFLPVTHCVSNIYRIKNQHVVALK
jgi:hypothetical protein